jgi:aminoglycoside phosphotransferase (APT) family kinase protein
MSFLCPFKNVWDNICHPRAPAQVPFRPSRNRIRVKNAVLEKRPCRMARVAKSITNHMYWKPRPGISVFADTRNDTTTQVATTSGPSKLPKIDSAIVSNERWDLKEIMQDYQLSEQPSANDNYHTFPETSLEFLRESSSRESFPVPCPTPASGLVALVNSVAQAADCETIAIDTNNCSVDTKMPAVGANTSLVDTKARASDTKSPSLSSGDSSSDSDVSLSSAKSSSSISAYSLQGHRLVDSVLGPEFGMKDVSTLSEKDLFPAAMSGAAEALHLPVSEDQHFDRDSGEESTTEISMDMHVNEQVEDDEDKDGNELETKMEQISISKPTDKSDEEAHEEKSEDKDVSEREGDTESIKSPRLERHFKTDCWDQVHGISDLRFKNLVLLTATIDWPGTDAITADNCHVVRRFDGGYNHIVEITIGEGSDCEGYIVRVPAVGNAAHWQEGDAHNIRCEVALMKYLRKETKIPVPEIVAFEDELYTMIGAPYILMKKLPGKPAYEGWFEKCQDHSHVSENRISPETEAVRCSILRSLAATMVELQNIEFDKIGMPDFTATVDRGEKPTITHAYRWVEDTTQTEDQLVLYGPFDSSSEYMTSKLEEMWSTTVDPEDDVHIQNMFLGVRKILDIIYAHPTISFSRKDPSQTETFVLRHPDLDLQNILIDDAGNITGIIDWEGCLAVPRCVGYTCLPEFLRRDWTSTFSLEDSPHISWRINHYRRIYADAMLATGCADAKYTRKSAMYRAIVDAVNNNDNRSCSAPDLITKMVAQMPDLNTCDLEELQASLGQGWEEAEEFLKGEIGRLVEPEV